MKLYFSFTASHGKLNDRNCSETDYIHFMYWKKKHINLICPAKKKTCALFCMLNFVYYSSQCTILQASGKEYGS